MKKFFEFILVIIIFYGVYSAFVNISYLFNQQMKPIWVILISLVVSALLLSLYSLIISSRAKRKIKENIQDLHTELKNKDGLIAEKEEEIRKAQTFKNNLIQEAESFEHLE